MDPEQVSSLWKLLRKDGDKILNSEFKLTLSGPSLRALNDSFTLIADQSELSSSQSFQVLKPNNYSKSEVFRELQFIYDFVQKTIVLCVTLFPGDTYFESSIDISKFRSLRKLEIHKVNIKQITGIQKLRAQLHELACIRSIKNIEDILVDCGGDNSNGFAWNELKAANFSFNNLKAIDTCLEFTQYLENLNLSHNQIASVDAIKWLPNLKVLDLSFNRLNFVPAFHIEANRHLKVLILSNNFIEELDGISRLDALNELDLSQNCLLDHSCLYTLSSLGALCYLNLSDNPLYCHPKHRQLTAFYLNKNTGKTKFVLDKQPLSRYEKYFIGTSRNNQTLSTNRFSLLPKPKILQTTANPTPQLQILESGSTNKSMRNGDSDSMTTSVSGNQRKIKARTVEFEEQKTLVNDDNIDEEKEDVKQEKLENPTPEIYEEHLDAKQQIEDLRERFGSEWLQKENVHAVKSVLGISHSPENQSSRLFAQQILGDILVNTSNISNTSFDNDSNTVLDETKSLTLTSTPIQSGKEIKFAPESPVGSVKSSETLYKSIDGKSIDQNETIYKSLPENEEVQEKKSRNLDLMYKVSQDEPTISDPEDNEVTYIVHSDGQNIEILLVVSDISIREKDIITGRTRSKWSLNRVESCDRIKSDTLRINFDTIKKDKKERIYVVKEGLCQQLEKYLRGILAERSLFEMNQTIYKCVKCSMQFSRENKYKRENFDIPCPLCNSTFIIEIEESPKTLTNVNEHALKVLGETSALTTTTSSTMVRPKSAGDKLNAMEKSSSHSSIGSAGYLTESSSCSKISNSKSSFDSNQSVAGSSAQDRDVDLVFNKNGESDIEILSNPSQSSIEVLEQALSSRKASEERRIYHVPSLETIQDTSLSNVYNFPQISKEATVGTDVNINPTTTNEKKNLFTNLTESSSSGSVTDSICTAYEQADKTAEAAHSGSVVDSKTGIIQHQTHPPQKTQEKISKNDPSLISSMLGGLFQSTNTLLSRSQKPEESDAPSYEKFKYSYNDFSDADHKLKLYLYQNVFKDGDEHFKWLVKGKIVSNGNKYELYDGIIVMSTTKFYILKITGEESEEISKWLKRCIHVNVDRLQSIQMLPSKMGFTVDLKKLGYFHVLLQDGLRTDNLWLFFTNNPLPDECTIQHKPLEKLTEKILKITNEEPKLMSILNLCEISADDIKKTYSPSGFITTDTHLYLTTQSFGWLSEDMNLNIEVGHTQLMSNLIEIDRPAKNIFAINFHDESLDKYELWECIFETEESANSCFNAIGQSWEALFGVPLEIN